MTSGFPTQRDCSAESISMSLPQHGYTRVHTSQRNVGNDPHEIFHHTFCNNSPNSRNSNTGNNFWQIKSGNMNLTNFWSVKGGIKICSKVIHARSADHTHGDFISTKSIGYSPRPIITRSHHPPFPFLILGNGLRPANERCRYKVTPSLIG